MIKNAFQDLGNVLLMLPEDAASMEKVDNLFAALASSFDEEYIAKKCRIPMVIGDVVVERFAASAAPVAPASLVAAPKAATEVPKSEPQPAPMVKEVEPESEVVDSVAEVGATSLSSAPESTLRVDAEKIDAVLNLVGELIIGKSMLTQTISEFDKKFGRD